VDTGLRRHDEVGATGESIIRAPGISRCTRHDMPVRTHPLHRVNAIGCTSSSTNAAPERPASVRSRRTRLASAC